MMGIVSGALFRLSKIMKKMTLLAMIVLLVSACSSSLKVDVKSGITVEYGSELKIENLTDQKDISVKEIKDLDSKKIGDQKVTVVFTNKDGKETTKEITISVKDTQFPVIQLKKEKVEITTGDKFDAKTNVKSIKDPVDGDIKFSDQKDLSKDGYSISGKVDTGKAGTYKLKVTAFDKNGNKAEKEYSVIVKEKPKEETQASNQTQGNNYKAPVTNQSTSNSSNSTPSTNNSQASASTPSKTVCPNGNEPINPSLPCDAVINWYHANPQIAFSSCDEADKWAWEQMDKPEYYKKYSGYSVAPVTRNDQSDTYAVQFY